MSHIESAPDKSLLYADCDIAEVKLAGNAELPYMAQLQPSRFVALFAMPATLTGQPEARIGRHRRNPNVIPLVAEQPEDGGRYHFLRRALETAIEYGGQVVISSEGEEVVYEHDEDSLRFADGLFALGRGRIPEELGHLAGAYTLAQGLDEIEQLRQARPPIGEAC